MHRIYRLVYVDLKSVLVFFFLRPQNAGVYGWITCKRCQEKKRRISKGRHFFVSTTVFLFFFFICYH